MHKKITYLRSNKNNNESQMRLLTYSGVTGGYKGLQRVTGGYRGFHGDTGVTRGYRRLQVTGGYERLQGVTKGYKGFQAVTRGYNK